MALDDIVFAEGDPQNFVVEVSLDTLHAPLDVLFDTGSSASLPQLEIVPSAPSRAEIIMVT